MPQSAEFEATEVLWLQAGPGSLTLQTRWQVKVGRGTVRQLILELDPTTHLFPPDDASVISRVRPMNDGKHVQLEFREPVDDSIVFDLSFVLEPPAAPGRIAWPRISLLSAKQTRRILAASSTPQIVLQTFPIPGAKTLSPAEFALLWPTPTIRPKWIVEVPSTSGDWEFQIAPRPSTISANYQAIAAARRRTNRPPLVSRLANQRRAPPRVPNPSARVARRRGRRHQRRRGPAHLRVGLRIDQATFPSSSKAQWSASLRSDYSAQSLLIPMAMRQFPAWPCSTRSHNRKRSSSHVGPTHQSLSPIPLDWSSCRPRTADRDTATSRGNSS